jgi:hypothetical protein
MRKHKSVVAILLAVMMIFTFMPTMAFAGTADPYGVEVDETVPDTTYSWEDDFSAVTVNGTLVTATRTAVDENNAWFNDGWNGLIRARAIYENPETEGKMAFVAYYRDLNGATVSGVKKSYAHSGFASAANAAMNGDNVTLSIPDYLSNKNDVMDGKTYWEAEIEHLDVAYPLQWNVTESGKYTKQVKGLPYSYETLPEEETAYNAAVLIGTRSEYKPYGTINAPAVVDGTFTQKITKKAVSTGVSNAVFTLEGASYEISTADFGPAYGKDEQEEIYTIYNGAEQTLVMKAMTGYSVSYATYDYAKGKYVATDKVVVKDVVDEHTLVKATVTKDATKEKGIYLFELIVAPAGTPTVGFDKDGNVGDYQYKVDGSEYNALDYIVVEPYAFNTTLTSGYNGSFYKNANKAYKAAVKADEATIMAMFNELKEIKSESKKANPNVFSLTVVDKDLTTAQVREILKKYESLTKNYFGTSYEGHLTAQITVNAAKKDGEVEFTNTPSSVTYKGNKKGKLTKDKSFTVTAVSNKGDTVFYKLINADTPKISIDKNTGKVTVKKGLKKGTYKIQVKAYTLEERWETQNITVKITKKGKKK